MRAVTHRAMHRLAVRLGIRDGQAYTAVTGLVLAIVLGLLGLPGVVRGVDSPLAAPAAASTGGPEVSPTGLDGDAAEVAAPTTPARPAGALPALSVSSGGRSPELDLPATGAMPPATDRPEGPASPDAATSVRARLERTEPVDVAVAPDGTLYVATDDGAGATPRGRLLAISTTGDVVGSWAAPDAPASVSRGLSGVTVDADGAVWVSDAGTGSVARLAGDVLEPVVRVPDLPACGLLGASGPCEPGLGNLPPTIESISADGDGLLVADRSQGAVWRIAGGEASLVATVSDRLLGEGPVAAGRLPDGSIAVAVSARLTSIPPGAAALLRIRPGEAEPDVVLDLGPGEVPGDLAVAESGRVYLTIPSAGTVADVGMEQGDRVDVDVGDVDPPMAAPTGLALGDRTLFVTDPGAVTDGSRPGFVHAIPVPDRPPAAPSP